MTYQTPLQSFLNNSQTYQHQPFLHQPVNGQWQVSSFSEVEQQARKIAQGLLAQGYSSGDRIGLFSKNCAQWFIADLAIMMAGMISVPIYATAGAKTISYVIEHSEMKAIFIGKLDSLDAAIMAISSELMTISMPYPTIDCQCSWDEWLLTYEPLIKLANPSLDDCVSIVYTSGTTGDPKGVKSSYLNFASAGQCTVDIIGTTNKDRLLSYLPLAHITERCVVECVAFTSGCQVFFVESLNTFIDDLRYTSPTSFLSVPRLWAKFQAQVLAQMPAKKLNFLLSIPILNAFIAKKIRTKLGLNSARIFASGSAPIPLSLLQWYQTIGINISEGWGMTETSGLSCGNFPFNTGYLGSIGKPIACVDMKLSEQNEILIRGEGVFEEYYLRPDLTQEAFTKGWFHTGDRAELSDDGSYKIVGRIKEQFKTSKGKYVVPVPIERMLCRNTSIEQVCVMGLGLKQPIALVVLAEGIRADDATLNALEHTLVDVNSELESHQRLDYIYVCNEGWSAENELLTPTLKLKRNDIEAQYQEKLPRQNTQRVYVEK